MVQLTRSGSTRSSGAASWWSIHVALVATALVEAHQGTTLAVNHSGSTSIAGAITGGVAIVVGKVWWWSSGNRWLSHSTCHHSTSDNHTSTGVPCQAIKENNVILDKKYINYYNMLLFFCVIVTVCVCVCVILLHEFPPWWMEKVIVYYYYFLTGASLTISIIMFHKKKGKIQYGNRIWETLAKVFSQTLIHGNTKNETRQTKEEGKKWGSSMARGKVGTKKTKSWQSIPT